MPECVIMSKLCMNRLKEVGESTEEPAGEVSLGGWRAVIDNAGTSTNEDVRQPFPVVSVDVCFVNEQFVKIYIYIYIYIFFYI